MFGQLAIPHSEDGGPVVGFRAEDFVRIFLLLLHQLGPLGRVLHGLAEIILEFLFILGVGMAVVDFHAVEAVAFGIGRFFQVREKFQLGSRLGEAQQVIVLRAGDNKDAAFQHLGAGALGMVGILSVNVNYSTVVVVDADGGKRLAFFRKTKPGLVSSL